MAQFRLLETIRAYATERLQEVGETAALERRHAEYFLGLAEAAGAHPESAEWLQALEAAIDDVRAAINWALTTRARDILVRFAGALGWYWATWHDQEGIQWMRAILDTVQPEASPAFAERHIHTADQALAEVGDAWGRALAALSRFRLNLHTGSLQQAIQAGREALERFHVLGDPWGIPWTTMWLGTATRMTGDLQQATQLFQEAIAAADHLGYVRCTARAELGCLAALQGAHERAGEHQQVAADLAPTTGVRDSIALAANAAGLIARFRGDSLQAKASHLQALAVFQELDSKIGIAYTHCCLGYANHHLGHASTAAQHFGDALALAHRAGRSDILAAALEGLACAAAPHDVETCTRLLGAAQRIRETTGIHLTMIEGHDPQQAKAHARSVLGTKQFAAATNTGKHSSLDEMPLGATARTFKSGL